MSALKKENKKNSRFVVADFSGGLIVLPFDFLSIGVVTATMGGDEARPPQIKSIHGAAAII